MKRTFKLAAVAMSVLLTGGTLAACGGTRVGSKDKRPTIFVSIFNGGYGKEWLDDIITAYNEEHSENEYKIDVRDSKDEFSTISSQIQAGTAVYDMFLISGQIYRLIDGNYLEPLTDVFNATPEGSEKSIKDMLTVQDYVKAYTGRDNEMYAIPWQESLKGFVYDHDVFMKYGLLFKEDGTFVTSVGDTLSKGKDGVADTYDDGHPIDETQWEAMVVKATQVFGKAFTYSGKFQSYLNDLFCALLAQYDDVDSYKIHYTFDGQYDFDGDGTKETTVTPENMSVLADAPGKIFALKFMDKYLANKDAKLNIKTPYVNSKAGTLSYSHTDAQNDYIVNMAQNKDGKAGMLFEGDWWENEAKTTFMALEEAEVADYAFRTRNYRYMTLPNFAGQKTETTDNVFAIGDNMFIALKKQTNDTKKTICKDFITYMYQPRWIQNYAVRTGGVSPYDVQLTAEQSTQLSPFAKNVRDIYYGDSTQLIRPQLLINSNATIKAGMPQLTENGEHYVVTDGLYYYSAENYIKKQKDLWSANYTDYYQKYQTYIAAGGR